MSVPLFAEYLGKDKSSIYENLYILARQAYIAKQYNSKTDRARHKAAHYYLTSKGIKYLRDHTDASRTALRNMYKYKAVSEQLVERSLATLHLVTQLSTQYPDTFEIFTKSEMAEDEDILRPLPDLYLERSRAGSQDGKNAHSDSRSNEQTAPHDYYIELLEPSVFSWLIRKRISAHQDQCDELGWDDYPYVLFIATNDSTENRIQKMLENAYQGFEFWTTTTERLTSGKTNIWRQVFEEDEDDIPILKNLTAL